MRKLKSLILTAVLVLAGMNYAYCADRLNGAGATFPYPVYAAWAWQYSKETGVRINYQSIGSGGGVRQIINRTVDFGASDAPLSPEEIEKHKLLQFPTLVGAVVLVVNFPGLKPSQLKLDSKTVCGIFMGKIKKWSAPEIKALNPDLKLPDKKITVVHRSDGSGTTAIFTHYLSGACPEWASKVGTGKAVKWPTGIGAKGNEGVSNYVKRVRYSIGYVEFAYAKQNRLIWTSLKNPAGAIVEPSFESFKSAAESANFSADKHFYLWLTNAPGKKAWPIAGATFILLARENKDVNKKVVRFFDWAFKKGDRIAEKLVYVPLPDSLKEKIRAYWKRHGI